MSQLRHTGTPWGEPASLGAMVNAVGEFAGSEYSAGPGLALIFFALTFLALFGLALDGRRIELGLRIRRPSLALAMATAGTLAVAIAGGLVSRSAFQARYASVVLPIFLLLAVLGTATLADRRVRTGVVAVAVGLGLVASATNVTTSRTQAGPVAVAINRHSQAGRRRRLLPRPAGPSVSRLLPSTLGPAHLSRRPARRGGRTTRGEERYGNPCLARPSLPGRTRAQHLVRRIGGYKTLDSNAKRSQPAGRSRHRGDGTGMIDRNGRSHNATWCRAPHRSAPGGVRPTQGPQQPRQCLEEQAARSGGAVDGQGEPPGRRQRARPGRRRPEGSGQKDRGQEDDGQAAVASSNLVGPGGFHVRRADGPLAST